MGSTQNRDNLKKGQAKIQFCVYCGGKLDEGARFCKYCGEAVMGLVAEEPDEVEISVIDEYRSSEELSVVQKLSEKLQSIDSEIVIEEATAPDKKGIAKFLKETQLKVKQSKAQKLKDERMIITISHFIIPDTVSDIMEFITLAENNINSGGSGKYDVVSKAWIVKAIKLYQRAQISIGDQGDFNKISNEMIRFRSIILNNGTGEQRVNKRTR